MKLENRTVLITGASSGLGRAMALALSQRNNRVIVTARRRELLDTLVTEIEANGSQAFARVNDATNTADCAATLDDAIARFGPIDVALLNVGGSPVHVMGSRSSSAADVLNAMRQNYDSLVNYLVPLIDHMRDRGGTIAHTGSPAGMFGLPKSGPYSASKAACRTLIDTCRIELADTPIRFVSLYPGFTYTEGLVDSEVPIKALIIQKERAVREMLGAIEKEKSHHMFPRRIRWPIALGRLVGEPARRWVLRTFAK